LYDLRDDEQESEDLSAREVVALSRLKQEMLAIYGEVQVEAPLWPDWVWARYESSRIIWPEYWRNRKRN
jgi:hypothetical protein